MSTKKTKLSIIQAGQRAVEELIKVAKEPIVDSGDDITADREEEKGMLNESENTKEKSFKGFAEGRSK